MSLRCKPRLALGALALLASCAAEALPATAVCEQTAVSVARQVVACTGDAALANRRYDEFMRRYSCTGVADERVFACAHAIGRAPCESVAASSFEPLVRRAAPVCARLVALNPNSAERPLAPGEAQLSGLFNGVNRHFACTFGPATLTSPGQAPSLATVVGATFCSSDSLSFLLTLSNLVPEATYTQNTGNMPHIGTLFFPQFAGSDDGALQAYRLQVRRARLDTDGYLRLVADIRVAKSGLHLQYDLSGTLDVVLQP